MFHTQPAQAVSLELAYDACSSWKASNFSMDLSSRTEHIDAGYCLGVIQTYRTAAIANCAHFEASGTLDPRLGLYGQFDGYSVEQVAESIIHYAERNPASRGSYLLWHGSRIADLAGFTCEPK